MSKGMARVRVALKAAWLPSEFREIPGETAPRSKRRMP